jgi:DNA-directed RNA polymerase subunit M/transcription elongation factor TFIIS
MPNIKTVRKEVKGILVKHFPPQNADIYEKSIYDASVAITSDDTEVPSTLETYISLAYEKVGQFITAPHLAEKIHADIDNGKRSWDSCIFESQRERYERMMSSLVEKPKPTKGVYICKEKKCNGNDEFYTWSMQTRSADEGMTHFRQCAKCGKRGKI